MKAKALLYSIPVLMAFVACESNFPDEMGSTTSLSNLQAAVRDSTNAYAVVDVTVDVNTTIYDCFDPAALEVFKEINFGEVRIEGVTLANKNENNQKKLQYGSDGKLHASFAVKRDWNEDEEAKVTYVWYYHSPMINCEEISSASTTVTVPAAVWLTSGAIDMGVSVKWAATNLGANNPWHNGNYYSFGSTTPSTNPSSFTEANYKGPGNSKGDISGNPAYDAATATLGAPWRMPTEAEFNELFNNCILYAGTWSGVSGLILESKTTGNFMFLPNTGYYNGAAGFNDIWNPYWTSTPKDATGGVSYEFFASGNIITVQTYNMYYYKGLPIRPVMK